jgi:hypothetical protein
MGLLFHVATDDNKSDGFTKPLGKLKFHQMVKDLSVDVCCSNCDAMVSSSLPHGGLFA